MTFQALTAAPTLRAGVSLNFMAVPQHDGVTLERIAAGASVTLRFGNCCPRIREGRIAFADEAHAVLAIDGAEWALEHGDTGISVPGIVSEDWVVTHRSA